MTTLTTHHAESGYDEAYRRKMDALAARPEMAEDNVRADKAKLSALGTTLAIAGAVGLAVLVLGGVSVGWKHAVASYIVGVASVLAITLGSMFWLMVFDLTNAGWHATIKRQWQNIMAQAPLCVLLLAPYVIFEVASGGTLLTWMNEELKGTFLIDWKEPFLNVGFFIVRFAIYSGIWIFLSRRLFALSLEQDRTGDRWLSRKARFMSGWGVLALALTLTFAAFDYLMSMDYRFFSTMWGVYFFAGGAGASVATLILVLTALRSMGRLKGLVGEEHFADLGKMLFAFCVFWAYIGFSQYFLIWYANIPEETAYFLHRQQGGWMTLSFILVAGKFLLPFALLLFRPIKRSRWALPAVAVWLLVMHVLDMVWIVRPMVYVGDMIDQNPGVGGWWLDLFGIGGVVLVWTGLLIRRIGAHPLIPLRDPRLDEGIAHKNYVG